MGLAVDGRRAIGDCICRCAAPGDWNTWGDIRDIGELGRAQCAEYPGIRGHHFILPRLLSAPAGTDAVFCCRLASIGPRPRGADDPATSRAPP